MDQRTPGAADQAAESGFDVVSITTLLRTGLKTWDCLRVCLALPVAPPTRRLGWACRVV
jgi:hypothetical protein